MPSILDIARKAGLEVVRTGDEFLVRCPWSDRHQNGDKHPSCRLNPDKNAFYCDPCGRGGGVVEFAKERGIELPPTRRPRPSTNSGRAKPTFEDKGPVDTEVRDYFASRLGKDYSLETWQAFGVQQGCVGGQSAVAFPLPGGGWKVCLYRISSKKTAKPYSWLFCNSGKSDLLLIGEDQTVLLCAGEWDAMAAYTSGVPCVATGTGGEGTWKKEWSKRLFGKSVIVAYDVDEAGRTGARRVINALQGRASSVRALDLPLSGAEEDGKDLSDFITCFGPSGLLDLVAEAKGDAKEGTVEDSVPTEEPLIDLVVKSALGDLSPNSSLSAFEEALGSLALILRDANPLRRSVAREQAIRMLKDLGISAPAKMVDAALGEIPDSNSDESTQSFLSDPEPWPDPVNGSELLEELVAAFVRFIVLPEEAHLAMALWVLHAHATEAAQVSPILILSSPTKRCGKSTLLSVLQSLVPRPLPTSNITPAAVFRSIDEFHPTLLIDEADSFFRRNEDLRNILNSGHLRSMAYVTRCDGDDNKPRIFSTWAPKAIGCIGKVAGTLMDRGIVIPMKRKTAEERVKRLRLDRLEELEPFRQKAARWALDNLGELTEAEPIVPDVLGDRAQDNWRPLLAIADLIGGPWAELARVAAKNLSLHSDEHDQSVSIQLLGDIRDAFLESGTDRMASVQVINFLTAMEDRPWGEWKNGKPITVIQLAQLLKPFDIRPKTLRIGESTMKGYGFAWFTDTFRRYQIDPKQPKQACVFNELESKPTRNGNGDVPGRERDLNTPQQRDVPDVTGQNRNPGQASLDLDTKPPREFD